MGVVLGVWCWVCGVGCVVWGVWCWVCGVGCGVGCVVLGVWCWVCAMVRVVLGVWCWACVVVRVVWCLRACVRASSMSLVVTVKVRGCVWPSPVNVAGGCVPVSVSHVVTTVQGMYVKPNWTVARCIGGLLQVRLVAVIGRHGHGPSAPSNWPSGVGCTLLLPAVCPFWCRVRHMLSCFGCPVLCCTVAVASTQP